LNACTGYLYGLSVQVSVPRLYTWSSQPPRGISGSVQRHMQPPRREKRSSAELDDLARQAARLAYEDGLDAPLIATRLGLRRGAREVTTLLLRARGIVSVRVLPREDAPLLDEALARELEQLLGLRGAFVVHVDEAL